MSQAKKNYGNESISVLKGADRVRKRPAVIFGSDDLEGCKHSVFEIVSNSIDEARDGHGDRIIVTKFLDKSIEVEDFGRGCPVDFNNAEQRWNWELVYCELYAGGKYDNSDYEYSLGLNGLGACATQYASEYMDVEVRRDGYKYNLHFEKGENIGGLSKEPYKGRATGTKTRWKPDSEVFTDIDIPRDYFETILKKQAVVNPKVTFVFRCETEEGGFDEVSYYYENGITDYLEEIVGEDKLTPMQFCSCERKGRDAADEGLGVDLGGRRIIKKAATKKVLKKTGWKVEDFDLIEANEAFAAQSIAVARDLGFNKDILNVNGGAIAIGHPVGASGCRILTTLLYEMQKRDAKKGLATLCIGGGMGCATIVERD